MLVLTFELTLKKYRNIKLAVLKQPVNSLLWHRMGYITVTIKRDKKEFKQKAKDHM